MPSIRCAHCKSRHDTVAQVRLCAHRQQAPAPAPVAPAAPPAGRTWTEWKNEFAEREAEQECEVYAAEMRRDDELACGLRYGWR